GEGGLPIQIVCGWGKERKQCKDSPRSLGLRRFVERCHRKGSLCLRRSEACGWNTQAHREMRDNECASITVPMVSWRILELGGGFLGPCPQSA
ncbi:unnamed protein product, partial [Mycena citricolor]